MQNVILNSFFKHFFTTILIFYSRPDGNKVKHNKWGTNMSDLIFHAATEQKEWLNLQTHSSPHLSLGQE